MPMRSLMSAYIEEPPEIEARGGMFFIRQRFSDGLTVERVMLPATFFRGFQNAARAIQLYHAAEGGETPDTSDIIPFPRAS